VSVRGRESRLARLTRREAMARAADGAVGLLPVASLEQHGDHLPLGTDALLVEAVCLLAAELTSCDLLVAPPVWTGISPHHLRFGATATVTPETFGAVVRETAESLGSWLVRVVVVNGHGGNRAALRELALEEGLDAVSYWELPEAVAGGREAFRGDYGSIGHAGQAETSMVLALQPELVGEAAADFEPCSPGDPLHAPELGASGVIGNPATASEQAGATYLQAAGRALATYLEQPAGGTRL
jgi:creatinine amidohydrolase